MKENYSDFLIFFLSHSLYLYYLKISTRNNQSLTSFGLFRRKIRRAVVVRFLFSFSSFVSVDVFNSLSLSQFLWYKFGQRHFSQRKKLLTILLRDLYSFFLITRHTHTHTLLDSLYYYEVHGKFSHKFAFSRNTAHIIAKERGE